MTPHLPAPDGGWRPVPPGTLAGLARRAVDRRNRRRIATFATAACLALVMTWTAVGVAYLRASAPDAQGFEYAGIRCGEVRDLLPAYMAGTLPPAKAAQVRAHVTKCSICSDRVRRAKAGLPVGVVRGPETRVVAFAPAARAVRRRPDGTVLTVSRLTDPSLRR